MVFDSLVRTEMIDKAKIQLDRKVCKIMRKARQKTGKIYNNKKTSKQRKNTDKNIKTVRYEDKTEKKIRCYRKG